MLITYSKILDLLINSKIKNPDSKNTEAFNTINGDNDIFVFSCSLNALFNASNDEEHK